MRPRVALMTMALGIAVAGSAQAHDATRVIYDLSALRSPQTQAPASRAGHDVGLSTSSLPISTPSMDARNDGSNLPMGDDLELTRHPRGGLQGIGVGSPRGGNDDHPDNNPNPTPEPGSMLLLGGALASGARRFLRRR